MSLHLPKRRLMSICLMEQRLAGILQRGFSDIVTCGKLFHLFLNLRFFQPKPWKERWEGELQTWLNSHLEVQLKGHIQLGTTKLAENIVQFLGTMPGWWEKTEKHTQAFPGVLLTGRPLPQLLERLSWYNLVFHTHFRENQLAQSRVACPHWSSWALHARWL